MGYNIMPIGEDEPVYVEVDDEGGTPMERAVRVKRYAQKVVRLMEEGKYDPHKTALARMMGLQSARQLEDMADDLDAFTPRQRRQLSRLAAGLRHQMKSAMGAHVRQMHTRKRGLPRRPSGRMTTLPIEGWEEDDDEELGIAPLLAAAIPAVASAVGPVMGGLFGGGKKKAPPPAPAPAPPVMVAPGGAGPAQAPSNVNLPAIGGVVADQIRAVPPPVRQQVVDAVRELLDQQKAGALDVKSMMDQIASLMGPKLQQQLSAVNNAALQRQATYEHEAINRSNKRWEKNAEAQKAILTRLNDMERKLGGALEKDMRRKNATARAFGIPTKYL